MTAPENRSLNGEDNFSRSVRRPPTDPRLKLQNPEKSSDTSGSQPIPSTSNPHPQTTVSNQNITQDPRKNSTASNPSRSQNSRHSINSRNSTNTRRNSPAISTSRSDKNNELPPGQISGTSRAGSSEASKKSRTSDHSEEPPSKVSRIEKDISSGANSRNHESRDLRPRSSDVHRPSSLDISKNQESAKKSLDCSPGSSKTPESSSNATSSKSQKFWKVEEAKKLFEESRSFFKKRNSVDFFTIEERNNIKKKMLIQADAAEALIEKIKRRDNYIQKLQEDYKRREEEINCLKDKVSKQEKEKQALAKDEHSEEDSKRANEKFEAMNNTLNQRNSEISDLKRMKEGTDRELHRLRTELTKSEKEKTERVSQKDAEITALKKNKEGMEKQIQAIAEAMTRNADRVKTETESIEKKYKKEIKDLTDQLKEEKNSKLNIEKELMKTRTTLLSTEAELNMKNKEILEFCSSEIQISITKDLLQSKCDEIGEKDVEISNLKSKIKELEEEVRKKTPIGSIPQSEFNDLFQDLKQTRNYLEKFMNDNKDLLEKNNQLQAKSEMRKKKLVELKKVLKAKEQIESSESQKNASEPGISDNTSTSSDPKKSSNSRVERNKSSEKPDNNSTPTNPQLSNSESTVLSSSNVGPRGSTNPASNVVLPAISTANQRQLSRNMQTESVERNGSQTALNASHANINKPTNQHSCLPCVSVDFNNQAVQEAVKCYLRTSGGVLNQKQVKFLQLVKDLEEKGLPIIPNQIIHELVIIEKASQLEKSQVQRNPIQNPPRPVVPLVQNPRSHLRQLLNPPSNLQLMNQQFLPNQLPSNPRLLLNPNLSSFINQPNQLQDYRFNSLNLRQPQNPLAHANGIRHPQGFQIPNELLLSQIINPLGVSVNISNEEISHAAEAVKTAIGLLEEDLPPLDKIINTVGKFVEEHQKSMPRRSKEVIIEKFINNLL